MSEVNEKQPPEFSMKKLFLKFFAIFTSKHLCWSRFFNKVDSNTGVFPQFPAMEFLFQ